MSTHLYDHRAPQPRSRAAWLASLAVHATTLIALGYLSWTTLGGSPAHHRLSETSVVLGLGDGFGAGIVIDGRLHRGDAGGAGEVSFLPSPDRPLGAEAMGAP